MTYKGEIMADPKQSENTEEQGADASGASSTTSGKKRIMLVPYPKFVFLYPTMIVSFIAWLVMYLGGYHAVDPMEHQTPVFVTGIFMAVAMANLFVIVFVVIFWIANVRLKSYVLE